MRKISLFFRQLMEKLKDAWGRYKYYRELGRASHMADKRELR